MWRANYLNELGAHAGKPQQTDLRRFMGGPAKQTLEDEETVERSKRVLAALDKVRSEWPPIPVADDMLRAVVLNTATWCVRALRGQKVMHTLSHSQRSAGAGWMRD